MNGIDQAQKDLDKKYGKGSVVRLGDSPLDDISVIPTGNILLDMGLGVGGYPRGRICEIYGPESSGKTTLALHAVAEAQAMGLEACFIDAEHALDPTYAESIGVDVPNVLFNQPGTGEEALEVVLQMASTNEVGIIVVDSVAALTPRAEIEGDMGDAHVGLQARLLSQAMRKLNGAIYDSNTVMIFINQIREKIGVMFGSPETTPGGRALKFYSSVRLDIRRIGAIKDGTDIVGNETRVKVVKNKVSPPFKQVEFDIIYGKGISKAGSILDLAVMEDVVPKSGAWLTVNGERLQGRPAAVAYLNENPVYMQELYEELAYEKE